MNMELEMELKLEQRLYLLEKELTTIKSTLKIIPEEIFEKIDDYEIKIKLYESRNENEKADVIMKNYILQLIDSKQTNKILELIPEYYYKRALPEISERHVSKEPSLAYWIYYSKYEPIVKKAILYSFDEIINREEFKKAINMTYYCIDLYNHWLPQEIEYKQIATEIANHIYFPIISKFKTEISKIKEYTPEIYSMYDVLTKLIDRKLYYKEEYSEIEIINTKSDKEEITKLYDRYKPQYKESIPYKTSSMHDERYWEWGLD